MANTAQLVDDILTDHEGLVPGATSSLTRRAGVVRAAQRALGYIWNLRPWAFKYIEGTVSCTTGAGYLPTAFLRMGPHGGAYLTATKRFLRWVSLKQMEQLRLQQAETATSEYYSVGGTVSLADSTNVGKRIFYIYPKETATINIAYERAAPTLVDGGHAPSPATDGMLELPATFYSALYELVVYKRMVEKGNATQSAEQKSIYSEALADLIRVEQQGVEASHYVVPYSGRNL